MGKSPQEKTAYNSKLRRNIERVIDLDLKGLKRVEIARQMGVTPEGLKKFTDSDFYKDQFAVAQKRADQRQEDIIQARLQEYDMTLTKRIKLLEKLSEEQLIIVACIQSLVRTFVGKLNRGYESDGSQAIQSQKDVIKLIAELQTLANKTSAEARLGFAFTTQIDEVQKALDEKIEKVA